MELVYLWVEAYKNIHNQGFNFSPRFHCDYDPDSNELTINANDDYIENFFGDNINVTAIVGKNGSGKSSVVFQEEGNGGQEWTKGFKIIFKNETLELIEPFNTFRDSDRSPFVKIFNISNNTKYQYIVKSIYDNIDFNNYTDQYCLREAMDNKLDDEYSLYYDGDILRYLNTYNLDYHMYGTYGFSHENPNSLTSFIEVEANFEEDGNLVDFEYRIRTDNLERKIKKIITNKEYKLLELLDFEIKLDDDNFLFRLSSGQRAMILFLTLLLDKVHELNKDLIIYLDEPDSALHPQWQKKLIHNLIKVFSKNKKINIHIIITTHSPFLLSDIPKQNIIFLDTNEAGKCKVVDGLKEKKQTFGANIHTLLSDSFFMEEGLMGEFAKGKIDKAITLLNQEHLNDKDLKYCEQIISIIGEPIVKNQLQRMLDSKRLKKIDEIDAIKSSMEAMQKRLDELEK